ncbi:MAG TPA: redoxin family protein [Candidatus Gracilibacteria bacterium]|nr:redoxin family protein [Candidatus Gracilibacteria bacterium]
MKKNITLGIVVVLIVGSIVYFELQKKPAPALKDSTVVTPSSQSEGREKIIADKDKKYGQAMEFVDASGYINTDGIKISDLVGKKVILLDFWTYSCINCQRTTPYLNEWYEKYHDKGFEILGVHTPEFEFEKELANVQSAVDKFDIKYPVILDNEYSIWRTYGNRYWPRKYLIDIDGFVVYDHIGEGAYEETEKKIQELLKERAEVLKTEVDLADDMVTPKEVQEVDYSKKDSPEIYFGYERNQYLGNGKIGTPGLQTFTAPTTVERNKLYLVGDWEITAQYAQAKSANAKIIFRYTAKDVYMVASALAANAAGGAQIALTLDGKPLGEIGGEDVDKSKSAAIVMADRLYKLVQGQEYGEHTLEITVKDTGEDPAFRAFTFTFG